VSTDASFRLRAPGPCDLACDTYANWWSRLLARDRGAGWSRAAALVPPRRRARDTAQDSGSGRSGSHRSRRARGRGPNPRSCSRASIRCDWHAWGHDLEVTAPGVAHGHFTGGDQLGRKRLRPAARVLDVSPMSLRAYRLGPCPTIHVVARSARLRESWWVAGSWRPCADAIRVARESGRHVGASDEPLGRK